MQFNSRIKYIVLLFTAALFLSACGGGGGSNTTTSGGQSTTLSLQADAGNIIGVRVGETANLDGSTSSSSTNSSLSYQWSFTYKPQGSNALLINPTSSTSNFVPDVVGSYMVQLIVKTDTLTSQRTIALVEASISGNYTGNVRVHTSFSSQCSTCHDGRFSNANVNPGIILTKSGSHIGTTNMCQSCHTTFGFNLIRYVDHKEVVGNCSSCHNGVDAVGKSTNHLTTNSECSDCHTTTSFLTLDINGKYDHTGIISGCDSCHNGKVAIGTKHNSTTAALPSSNGDCVLCHNTTTFAEAKPDHAILLSNANSGGARCDSCHGVTATGPITGHPNMSAPSPDVDCVECHSVNQFTLAGVYNHRAVLSCDTCHTDFNSINAIGKGAAPNGHLSTTLDCSVCHGVAGASFANATIDHSLTEVVNARCDSCHDGIIALGQSLNHITTTVADCDTCHSPGNFITGTFDHTIDNMVGLTCSGCHNGTNSAGKTVNHIPTLLECDSCHDIDTPAAPSSFKGALFHPTNTPTSCVSCHDGVIQKGKNLTHLSSTSDCAACHTTTTPLTFVGGTFNHSSEGVTATTKCASCHNGVIAIDKTAKANHIPAIQECNQCHTDTTVTGGFATSNFKTDVHPSLSTGCEGCHTAKFMSATPLLIKATTHIPTILDCNSCHSNTNFADKTLFTHDGITGNCESCHDGNYFTSANAMGKVQDPTPPHPDTTADCGLCHGIGNNFTDGIFDHSGIVDNCSSCHADNAPSPPTGAVTRKSVFPAHVITTQDCSVCHIPGTFKTAVFNHNQIVTGCVDCHLDPGATATAKPTPAQGHVDTTKDCFECHNTTAFAGAKYDHIGITKNCASCHDGIIALGKDGNHVPTSKDCSTCHQTTGFIPGTFDHTGIIDNCSSCHDGALALGKPLVHVDTISDCGLCHTPSGFKPATIDHSGVSNTTRCDSCHGVTSTGKDTKTNPLHWETSLDCRTCHTTATFLGGTWTHENNSQGTCDTCHTPSDGTNGGARDKSFATNHITTTSQCDQCHTTNAWAPTSFTHDINLLTQDGYPGDHRRVLPCSSCHGNSVAPITSYPSNQYVKPLQNNEVNNDPYCAACHANDFDRKGDHNGGENGTVEQNKNCAASGCHRVGDSEF